MQKQLLHLRWIVAAIVLGSLALIAMSRLCIDKLRGHFPCMYSPSWIGNWLGVAATMLFLFGVVGACWLAKYPNSRIRNTLLITWTLGPPLYFVFSYHLLFRYFGVEEAADHYWNS